VEETLAAFQAAVIDRLSTQGIGLRPQMPWAREGIPFLPLLSAETTLPQVGLDDGRTERLLCQAIQPALHLVDQVEALAALR